jgi:hypothetical protein
LEVQATTCQDRAPFCGCAPDWPDRQLGELATTETQQLIFTNKEKEHWDFTFKNEIEIMEMFIYSVVRLAQ